MKKIILILLVFSFFVGNVFADKVYGVDPTKPYQYENSDITNAGIDALGGTETTEEENCEDCLEKPTYMINVGELGPGISLARKGGTTEKKVNWLLGTVIQKLMIALASISVLVMTIGGGYMILNGGADEILNKGKTIFKSGVIAMAVALSSYVIVSIVLFILY